METSTPETTALHDALVDGAVAVCVKDGNGRVLMQDARCRQICGERSGTVCKYAPARIWMAFTV